MNTNIFFSESALCLRLILEIGGNVLTNEHKHLLFKICTLSKIDSGNWGECSHGEHKHLLFKICTLSKIDSGNWGECSHSEHKHLLFKICTLSKLGSGILAQDVFLLPCGCCR